MQSYREDKENYVLSNSDRIKPGSLHGSFLPLKKEGISSDAKADSTSRPNFGKLLSDVTNEIITETDEKIARQSQVDEAYDMATEWVREEKGRLRNSVSLSIPFVNLHDFHNTKIITK